MTDPQRFAAAAEEICAAGRFLFSRGWSPATSSNYSVRLDADHLAITVSGRPKGELSAADVMVVDLEGRAVGSDKRPSAETLLHSLMYRRHAQIGAVLHTHSVNATVLSRLKAGEGRLLLEDYELLKGLAGTESHAVQKSVPIFPNTQDIPALARDVDALLDAHPESHGYLIAGHGLYTWGASMAEARRHVEAFEFLFECEVLTLTLTGARP